MNILSKILIVAFMSISLNGVHAQDYYDTVSKGGIVQVIVESDTNISTGTGFFVDSHTFVTNFHVIYKLKGKVSGHISIVHPETGEHISVHSIQAVDIENDLAVLYVKKYESPVYYELFADTEESLSSSEAYIFDRRERSFPKLEGALVFDYPSEYSSRKTLTLFTFNQFDPRGLFGLSGSPVFSMDGKIIGVVTMQGMSSSNMRAVFSNIKTIKEVLLTSFVNCKSAHCLQNEVIRQENNGAVFIEYQ